jgi:hypothetical protein
VLTSRADGDPFEEALGSVDRRPGAADVVEQQQPAARDQDAFHLADRVFLLGDAVGPLLVFDEGGITGHPDHCQATAAALTAAGRLGLTVIAWASPDHVAEALNAEFETAFAGRPPEQIDLAITVDRASQLKAIACHASQSADNPVLWRRLELLGGTEHLRYLRRKTDASEPTRLA